MLAMLVARVVLGAVWIVAGLTKLPDPAGSVRAVRAFQLLPEAVVPAVGYGLPLLEVALGACLVLGVGVRIGAIVSAALLGAFIIGVTSAWARGLQTRYGTEVLRDSALLVVAAVLIRWPASRFALVSPKAAPELVPTEG